MQITIRNHKLLRLLGHDPKGKLPAMASLSVRTWLEVIWRRIVGR